VLMADNRRIAFVVGLVALLASSGATAQSPCVLGNENAQSDLALDLSNAERIFVRVQGFPELSSEYRINVDKTISIPVIGRTSVAGIGPACLEQVLSAAASKIAKREVFLTVETVAYKPIFITGAVSKPGASPWFPGLTVLHATALAGGLYRPPLAAGTTIDPSKIRRLTDNQRRLMARLARLRAELEDAATLEPPPEMTKIAPEEVATLFKAERELMMSRRAALANNIATLDRSMAVAREELSALQQTKGRIEQQLELRRQNRDKIQGLQQKGYVRLDRSLEEDLRVAELEQRVLDNSVARTRLSATLAGLERESGALNVGRKATLSSEISDLERELAANLIDLQGARLAAGAPVAAEGDEAVGYTIIRGAGENSTRISATETDVLRVGDVLVVALAIR
jgi:protein involved in polysaccharide export with SLBB domain